MYKRQLLSLPCLHRTPTEPPNRPKPYQMCIRDRGLYDHLYECENIDELNELGHALLEVCLLYTSRCV